MQCMLQTRPLDRVRSEMIPAWYLLFQMRPVLYIQVPSDGRFQDLLGQIFGFEVEQSRRDCRALDAAHDSALVAAHLHDQLH